MTVVGAGGVVISGWRKTRRFEKDHRKLTPALQDQVAQKLCDLRANPRPPGLRFEKLQAHASPSIYTIHITGNYKLSMTIEAGVATLRRVGTHDEIDRAP